MHLRREVLLFALAMQHELEAHAPRKGESWKTMSPLRLYNELQGDVLRLDSALGNRDTAKAMEKCADAGNLAMMIWARLGGAGQIPEFEGGRVMRARELLVDLYAEMGDQLERSAGLPDVESLLSGMAMCMAELLAVTSKDRDQASVEEETA